MLQMKIASRRSLSFFLACCLLAALCSSAVLAVGEDTARTEEIYRVVSLGDSYANGYGLSGTPEGEETLYGYKRDAAEAYPALIRDELEREGKTVELDQLAISAMRAEELRFLLDDGYAGDAYTARLFYDASGTDSEDRFYPAGVLEWAAAGKSGTPTRAEALESLRRAYRENIAEADLITVNVGTSNFTTCVKAQLSPEGPGADLSAFSPDLSEKFSEGKAYVAGVANSFLSDALPSDLPEGLVDALSYALVGFCTNFDAAMEEIRALNEDAQIVVVSLQNPMYGLSATLPGEDVVLPLGDLFGALINAANVYAATESPRSDSYLFADVRSEGHVEYFADELLAYEGDPATLSPAIKQSFCIGELALGERLKTRVPVVFDAALDSACDVLAQIFREALGVGQVDVSVLCPDLAEKVSAFQDAALEIVQTALESEEASFDLAAAYPDGIFDALSVRLGVSESRAASLALLCARLGLDDGFLSHPNAAGHLAIKEAVLLALSQGIGGDVFAAPVIEETMAALLSFLMEQGPAIAQRTCEKAQRTGSVPEHAAYVALGDGSAAAQGYAELVAGELDLSLENLAASGLLAQDAGELLSEHAARFASCDLVTVGFGFNAMNVFAAENLLSDGALVNWSDYLTEEQLPIVEALLRQLEETMIGEGVPAEYAEFMSTALEGYAYAYFGHVLSYAKLVDAIHAAAPQALVVLVGMYNPFEGVTLVLSETSRIDLGGYVQYLVGAANTYAASYALSNDNTLYVHAPAVETSLDETDLSFMDFFRLVYSRFSALDPTENGDAYVSAEIRKQLSCYGAGQYGDANDDGCVDMKDVVLLRQYMANYNFELGASTVRLSPGADANGDGKIDMKDIVLLRQYMANFNFETQSSTVVLGPRTEE